jgi:hypothetical protein
MARVHLPQALDPLTGGVRELAVEAADYRGMMQALDAEFPGVRAAIDGDMAVVIDGDIIDQPLLEALRADSEVHFIARLGGG